MKTRNFKLGDPQAQWDIYGDYKSSDFNFEDG